LTGLSGLETHEAGGQDLAEFGQAFGGSEAVGGDRVRVGVAVDHGDFSRGSAVAKGYLASRESIAESIG
jgi:hypothetical protein